MNKKLIALCGYPQSGKDTIAEYLVNMHGFERVSFADPLRRALLALNPFIPIRDDPHFSFRGGAYLSYLVGAGGWEGAKKIKHVRELLQRMGTEAGRDIHGSDCWVRLARKSIYGGLFTSKGGGVVITDMRFPNEVALVDSFTESAKVLKIHVSRPGHGPINDHASEQMDYKAISDCRVTNDGTVADLEAMAKQILRDLDGDAFEIVSDNQPSSPVTFNLLKKPWTWFGF